jgi:N-methylhydantoinase A
MEASGLEPARATVTYGLDMRYVGQMNEVPLPVERRELEGHDLARLRRAFELLYRQRYGEGTTHAGAQLEIINFRAEAVRMTDKPDFAPLFAGKSGAPSRRSRSIYMRGKGSVEAAVHSFDDLSPDTPIEGPAVIERESTTIWLPAPARATLDVYGNLAIDLP